MESLSEEVQKMILYEKADTKQKINEIFYNLSKINKKEIKSMTKEERIVLKDKTSKEVCELFQSFINKVSEYFPSNKFNFNLDKREFQWISSTITLKMNPVEELFRYIAWRWTDWKNYKEETLLEVEDEDYDIRLIKKTVKLKIPTLPFYWKTSLHHFEREDGKNF